MKTKVSQYTIEELISFRNIPPKIVVDPYDSSWKDEFDKIIQNRNGTLYEEIIIDILKVIDSLIKKYCNDLD